MSDTESSGVEAACSTAAVEASSPTGSGTLGLASKLTLAKLDGEETSRSGGTHKSVRTQADLLVQAPSLNQDQEKEAGGSPREGPAVQHNRGEVVGHPGMVQRAVEQPSAAVNPQEAVAVIPEIPAAIPEDRPVFAEARPTIVNQVAHPPRQAFRADRLETPALHSMSARRQALPFSLGRAGLAAGPVAPPAAPTSGFPRPATVTMDPTATPPVAAKAATAPPPPAATAAVKSIPAMIPEEGEEELSSSSTSSSPTGKGASFAQASSSSFGPELDEDSARLIEYYKALGPMQSDSDSDSD